MPNSYNDDTQLGERKRSERWDQFKDMQLRFSLKGKPSQYRVNLISLGRVGYSFSRQLLEYMKDDPSFSELNIWQRVAREIENAQATDISPEKSKAKMHQNLLGIMTCEENKVKFYEYRSLHDLGEIVKRNQSNPSIGDITVVASRYDFSFLLKGSKGKPIRQLQASAPADISLIENIVQTSVYDVSQGPEATMKRLLEERKIMERIVAQVTKETGLDQNRAETLIDSVIGIRELAKALQGYRGNMIIASNEVDTTAYVFAKQSHTDPRKTLGLSHNDQLRYERFLRNELPQALRSLPLYIPVVGSHNEFLTAINDLIELNNHPLCEVTDKDIDFSKLQKRVANFGHILYDARGSSDEDAPKAVLHMIRSIMYEDLRSDQIIRASTRYDRNAEYFIGLQLEHDNELAIPQTHMLKRMNNSERAIFEKGVEIQRCINQLLMENGIIPKEWEYEEFKPQIPPRVEVATKPAIETHKTKIAESSERVQIPSDLEIKLYALDTSARGDVKRIAEFDFHSEKAKRYFEFGTGKYSSYKKIFSDGINLYALYQRTKRGSHDLEFGAVVWDLKTGRLAREIKLDDKEPSSIFAYKGEIFISFVKDEERPLIRYCQSKEEIPYTGVKGLFDAIAAELPDGLRIFGIRGGEIYSWRGNVPHKPNILISLDSTLKKIGFHHEGINFIASESEESVVLVDLDQPRTKSCASLRGKYDISTLVDGSCSLATVNPDTKKVHVRMYKNAGKLMQGDGTTLVNPESEIPDLRPYPVVRSLTFAKDLLLIGDNKNKYQLINWRTPELKQLQYEPMSANLAYSALLIR